MRRRVVDLFSWRSSCEEEGAVGPDRNRPMGGGRTETSALDLVYLFSVALSVTMLCEAYDEAAESGQGSVRLG